MDKADYNNKMDYILNNPAKFQRLQKDPTENAKKSINHLIQRANSSTKYFNPVIGDYGPSYSYGTVKTYKPASYNWTSLMSAFQGHSTVMSTARRLTTLVLVLLAATRQTCADPQGFKVSPHIGSSGFTGITFPIIGGGSSGSSSSSSGSSSDSSSSSSSNSQGLDQWAQASSATKRVVNVVASPKQNAGKRSYNMYSESTSFQPTAFDGDPSYSSDNASKHDFFPGENFIFARVTKPSHDYHYQDQNNAKRHYDDRETRILAGKTPTSSIYAERRRLYKTTRLDPGETCPPSEGEEGINSGTASPSAGETGPRRRHDLMKRRLNAPLKKGHDLILKRDLIEVKRDLMQDHSTSSSTKFVLDPSSLYSQTGGSRATSSYASEQDRAGYNAKRNSSSRFFSFNASTQTLDLGLSFTVPFLSVPMSSIINFGQTTSTALTSLLAINWPALVAISVAILASAVILPYIARWVSGISAATGYSSSTTGSMYGRSLEEDPSFFPVAPFTSIINQLDDALDQYDLDSTSCMQRIVCSYVSSSEENMKNGEASSTDLIINGIAKSSLIERVFGKTSLTKAIDVGRSGASCSLQYPKCPFSLSGILRFLASYATVAT
ncbi:uncharacterized protein LOC143028806 [Oratosquilla oratoria]|uniref:uncharacterized protein LOC143028806 n=1 Tax=Oratosquilla oratoria TaxID=337810 RepID=UPI003F76FC9F